MTHKEPVIRATSLSKRFALYRSKWDRVRELLHPVRKKYHTDFFALRDINLAVEPGETLGIIGRNGSGKSTLLKIISGVMTATSGKMEVRGQVSSLLELGAGFHPELNAVENLYLHGLLRGVPRAETRKRIDSVLDFSGIGPYAEQPVKSYSSGMFVRLAFAAEVHMIPDVFIVDEALSVGDASFQMKCLKRMKELQNSGTAIVFVSHDASIVRSLCSRAVLLDRGRIAAEGSPIQVYDIYGGMIGSADENIEARASFADRSGSGEIRYAALWLEDLQGVRKNAFRSGEPVRIAMEIESSQSIDNPTIGFNIRDRSGHELFGINTALLGIETGAFRAGEKRRVTFELPLSLGPGICTLGASIHLLEVHTGSCFDWVNDALSFTIEPDPAYRFSGSSRIPAVFRVE